jgi:hypothetical protein
MLTRSKQEKQTIKNESPSTFRLLDLPRELLIPIVRSYRSPIEEKPSGLVIYQGEKGSGRYGVLKDLCLTHRDILPFAQEELFKRLDIRSDERMDRLNRSIASSELCKEYAGRTESIYLGSGVNADELMESGAYNPRELWSHTTAKFSDISKSRLNHCEPPSLTPLLSKDRFQNLRRLYVIEAQFDEVLALPNLATCAAYLWNFISIDAKAAFTSVNLPNLRRLIIFNYASRRGSIGKYFDSIIPQLDHLSLSWVDATDLEHLLLLSTSLQSLHCYYDGSEHEGLAKGFDQIRRMDVKGLYFNWMIERESSYNWETDFETIANFTKVMGEKDELERVTLELSFDYRTRPSRDVGNRALARWKGIKDELNSICVKNRIEVVAISCSYSYEADERDTLIWME